jgi:hypothetical protein
MICESSLAGDHCGDSAYASASIASSGAIRDQIISISAGYPLRNAYLDQRLQWRM